LGGWFTQDNRQNPIGTDFGLFCNLGKFLLSSQGIFGEANWATLFALIPHPPPKGVKV
jgi:hypothetical protein